MRPAANMPDCEIDSINPSGFFDLDQDRYCHQHCICGTITGPLTRYSFTSWAWQ